MLFQKCDTPCDTSGPKPRIILRKNIFYYMIELPYVNGKRRFFRKSLHTDNFFEARQIVKMWLAQGLNMRKPKFPVFENRSDYQIYAMKNKAKSIYKSGNLWVEIRKLLELIQFNIQDNQNEKMCLAFKIDPTKPFELSPSNNTENVELLLELDPYAQREMIIKEREIAVLKREMAITEREQKQAEREQQFYQKQQEFALMQATYQQMQYVKSASIDFLQRDEERYSTTPNIKPEAISIQTMLNKFAFKCGETKEETQRKQKIITKYTLEVGLTLDDDYSKFHHETVLTNIFRLIIDNPSIKGDQKRKHARWIKEFVIFATKKFSRYYDASVLEELPEIDGTKKSEKEPHEPYTDTQLQEIFSHEHKFFDKHPDFYWGCMLALFTGARLNAAFTLQYKDIYQKDGIWCVHFIEDYPGVKKLKTEESERLTPLHSTLINMGFVDYVQRQKSKRKATDTDFMFPICLTSGGVLNTHIPRNFFKFLEKIGIKDKDSGKYDFHSFRKNATMRMVKCNIDWSYINKIVGWLSRGSEGERSYTNYTIKQLSEALENLNYDFLQPEFDYWKKVMSKK